MWEGSSENGVKFCNGHVAPFGLCISGGHGKIFHFRGVFLCLLSLGKQKKASWGVGRKAPKMILLSEIQKITEFSHKTGTEIQIMIKAHIII